MKESENAWSQEAYQASSLVSRVRRRPCHQRRHGIGISLVARDGVPPAPPRRRLVRGQHLDQRTTSSRPTCSPRRPLETAKLMDNRGAVDIADAKEAGRRTKRTMGSRRMRRQPRARGATA